MNGIELKKVDNPKRRQNIKLALCLVSSNLLLILAFTLLGKEEKVQALSPIQERAFHENYERLNLPMELKIVYSPQDKDISVSIFSEDKKLLVKKAFLHPELSSEKNEEKEFVIEIPKASLEKVIAYQGSKLLAYPEIQTEDSKPIALGPRGVEYEITF